MDAAEETLQNKWSNVDHTPDVPVFTGNHGLQVQLPNNHTDMDILDLFLTNEFYHLVIEETNRYAKQYFEENIDLSKFARARQWKELHTTELQLFFAITLLSGIIQKPDMKMHW